MAGRDRTGRRRRGVVAAALASAIVLAGVLAGPATAAVPVTPSEALTGAVNEARAAVPGLPALRRASDLDAIAQRHAETMAARRKIFHNPRLTEEVQRWDVVGENVGVASDVDAVHAAFLASRAHRANVVDVRYRELGVGVARARSRLWVVEVFRTPVDAVADDVLAAGAALAAPELERAPAPRAVVLSGRRTAGRRATGPSLHQLGVLAAALAVVVLGVPQLERPSGGGWWARRDLNPHILSDTGT